METKYKLVKDLTGKAIAESACSGEFEKFVKRCGYHTKVVWDLEFEKYAIQQNGWVEFLVNGGFLVLSRPKETEDMVHIFTGISGPYKLHREVGGSGFSWLSVDRSGGAACGNHQTLEEAIRFARNSGELASFKNAKEAYKFLLSKL